LADVFFSGCPSFSLNMFCYQAASVRKFIFWKVGLETEVMVV